MKVGSGDDALFGDDTEAETAEDDETGEDGSAEEMQSIPWIFSRENVKSGRKMVQFYLRKNTKQDEKEFVKELEQNLGTSVPVTDAREAAYLVAMNNPDDVAKKLREWGFHLKE